MTARLVRRETIFLTPLPEESSRATLRKLRERLAEPVFTLYVEAASIILPSPRRADPSPHQSVIGHFVLRQDAVVPRGSFLTKGRSLTFSLPRSVP